MGIILALVRLSVDLRSRQMDLFLMNQNNLQTILEKLEANLAEVDRMASGHFVINAATSTTDNSFVRWINTLPEQLDFGKVTLQREKLRDNFNAFTESTHLYLEAVLSQSVQVWDTFLVEMFRNAVAQHFTGQVPFPIGSEEFPRKFSLTVQLPLDKNIDDIIERICERFAFEKYQDRVDKVYAIYSAKELKKEEPLEMIERFVTVRNVIQHARGVVRQRDLKPGSNSIELTQMTGKPISYGIGDKIELSYIDIVFFSASIKRAARELIGKVSN